MMQEMPSRGAHITMFVFSFIFGVIWGLLSIGAFKTMNQAINAGDVAQANLSAKKVRMFFFIGLAVNIAFILLSVIRAVSGS